MKKRNVDRNLDEKEERECEIGCGENGVVWCPSHTHVFCKGCFENMIKAQFGNNNSLMKYSCEMDECKNKKDIYFDDAFMLENLSGKFLLEFVSFARDQGERKGAEQFKKEMERKALEDSMKSEKDLFVEKIRLKLEDIATRKCPKCTIAYPDFTGCCAVQCNCSAYFCGFCEKLEEDEESCHAHIIRCTWNPRQGNFFAEKDEWVKANRDCKAVKMKEIIDNLDGNKRRWIEEDKTVASILKTHDIPFLYNNDDNIAIADDYFEDEDDDDHVDGIVDEEDADDEDDDDDDANDDDDDEEEGEIDFDDADLSELLLELNVRSLLHHRNSLDNEDKNDGDRSQNKKLAGIHENDIESGLVVDDTEAKKDVVDLFSLLHVNIETDAKESNVTCNSDHRLKSTTGVLPYICTLCNEPDQQTYSCSECGYYLCDACHQLALESIAQHTYSGDEVDEDVEAIGIEIEHLPRARVMNGFISDDVNELSFKVGDVVEITEKTDDHYWRGRIVGNDKEGLFPSMFVMEMNAEQVQQQQQQQNQQKGLRRAKNKSSLSADGVDNDQSLIFEEGAMIEVIAEIDDMYMIGRLDGKDGLVKKRDLD